MSKSVLLWIIVLMFVMGTTLVALAVKQSAALRGGGTSQGEPQAENEPLVRVGDTKEPWLTSFELTERSERKLGTKDLAGKIHIVSFFFATCPGTCKLQNQHLAGLVKEFEKDGVKFLAITCDPDTDSPAKLRDYASTNFNAPRDSWYFLTGDLLYTRRIAAEIYGVELDRKTHVEKFILVDRNGKIHGKYGWADDREFNTLKRELRELIKQPVKE